MVGVAEVFNVVYNHIYIWGPKLSAVISIILQIYMYFLCIECTFLFVL